MHRVYFENINGNKVYEALIYVIVVTKYVN